MSSNDKKQPPLSRNPASRLMDKYRGAKRGIARPGSAKSPPTRSDDIANRWPLPGLAPMTRVETSFGKVHAVALRKGDEVKTRSGEYRKIVWLNRILLDESLLNVMPDANPVRIRAGAIGR